MTPPDRPDDFGIYDAPRRIPLSIKILACIALASAIVLACLLLELAGVAPWGGA